MFQIPLVGLLVTAFSGPLSSATDSSKCPTVLTPYEATYFSQYYGLRLEGRRSLHGDGEGEIVLMHEVERFNSRVSERSVLKTDQGQLRVQRYDMLLSVFGIEREDHANFDWENRLISTRGRRERELPLDDDHFDPLGHQLALRCDLAQGRQEVSYQVVRKGKVKRYLFRRVGTESLDTALGRIQTVVVELVHDTDEQSTRIWVAPSLNHLLVKLHQRDDEDDLDSTLQLQTVQFK
jgi:hypothetical protein